MTLEDVKARPAELGATRLAELRKECAEHYGLHDWKLMDAQETVDYCTRCFFSPRFDPASI